MASLHQEAFDGIGSIRLNPETALRLCLEQDGPPDQVDEVGAQEIVFRNVLFRARGQAKKYTVKVEQEEAARVTFLDKEGHIIKVLT